MVNKDSHFADFVGFRPHAYKRTQQSLPPLCAAISSEIFKNYLQIKETLLIMIWKQ